VAQAMLRGAALAPALRGSGAATRSRRNAIDAVQPDPRCRFLREIPPFIAQV